MRARRIQLARAAVALAAAAAFAFACATSQPSQSCGASLALVDGETIHSNGAFQGQAQSCDATGVTAPADVGFGADWQSVELVERYFERKFQAVPHWDVSVADFCDHATVALSSDAATVKHPSDSYAPIHGDVIAYSDGIGHVGIVDSVSGSTVFVFEQNGSLTGTASYALGTETCIVHANANKGAVSSTDLCTGLPDGSYCGGDGIAGDAHTLYTCKSGLLQTNATYCASGCAELVGVGRDVCVTGLDGGGGSIVLDGGNTTTTDAGTKDASTDSAVADAGPLCPCGVTTDGVTTDRPCGSDFCDPQPGGLGDLYLCKARRRVYALTSR